jgi:hypothetical protein
MNVLKKTAKLIAAILITFALSVGVWCLWWYAPVSVSPKSIVKIINSDIAENQIRFCNMFAMTPDQFRAYWKDTRPIFDVEAHDYSFGSCYFKAVENGKEYAIGIGGTGTVTKGDTTYYYVRNGDKPDFDDLPRVKTTLMQDFEGIMHLVEYVFTHGIN